jgi:hypothetical protein
MVSVSAFINPQWHGATVPGQHNGENRAEVQVGGECTPVANERRYLACVAGTDGISWWILRCFETGKPRPRDG